MASPFGIPSTPVFTATLVALLASFGMYFDHVASDVPERASAALEGELARESASADVRRVAHWAVNTQDHAGLPFVVIDKASARIYAFDPRGRLRGSAPVMLGAARADPVAVRAAPAGRFVGSTLASARDGGIVWADAKSQVALRALPAKPAGQVPASNVAPADDKADAPSPLLVDPHFYREYLDTLRTQPSVAYVLPGAASLEQVFGMAPAGAASLAGRAEVARSPS